MDHLLNAIRVRAAEFYFKSGIRPNCVILNPVFYDILKDYHRINFSIEEGKKLMLFDLEIFRSVDVSEGDFKIGF
jgi:hypothetical protein